jgi:RNA polymerase sigma-70 factor (ECF subfamily)
MTVTVTPAAGWVRIKATVVGIPAGERCTLVVLDRSRDRYIAASWLASPAAEKNGITIEGAAIVAPGDLAAVAVQNLERHELVIAPA